MIRFSLQSMRKCRCRQHTLPESIIRMKSGYIARFARNGFTMSAFTFEKNTYCFLHSYCKNLLCNGSSVTIYLTKGGDNICSDIFRHVFYFRQNKNKQTKTFILSKTVAWKFSFSLAS